MDSTDLTYLSESQAAPDSAWVQATRRVLTNVGERNQNTNSSIYNTVLQLIEDVNYEEQVRGWWFNTESTFSMTPETNKTIDTSKVISFRSTTNNVVVRGDKLYDAENQTYQFEDDVEGDVVWALAFDETPLSFQKYIINKATRLMNLIDNGGNQYLLQSNQADEDKSWEALLREDTEAINNTLEW